MDLCQDSQDFSDYSSILSSEKDLTYLSELSEQNILGSESSANQSTVNPIIVPSIIALLL